MSPLRLRLVCCSTILWAAVGFANEPLKPEEVLLPADDLVVDFDFPVIARRPGPDINESKEPSPCVCVRGLIPAKKQREIVRKLIGNPAVRLDNRERYLDFVLERQEFRLSGLGSSGGKWERVAMDRSLKVLNDAQAFQIDGTPVGSRNTVVTMPLPQRTDGNWTDTASHPRINEQPGALLFRFIDFDVVPGVAYRYRVRLALSNPADAAERRGSPFGDGLASDTPWSKPSRIVYVPRARGE